MERFVILAPALALLAFFTLGLVVFTALSFTGRAPSPRGAKHNQLFGPFFGRYLVWILTPLERLLIGRVSPNAITATSLAMCVLAGAAAANEHLVGAVWLAACAGILDVLDGRIARQTGNQTPAGALFDSVSDRWGDLAILCGYVWYLRDSAWMAAALVAVCGSMMVSYTRARAEGLGVPMSGGLMQRAERVVLVAGGTLVAAWYATDGDPEVSELAVPIVGGTLLVMGVAACGTAVTRWIGAYRALVARVPPTAATSTTAKIAEGTPAPAPLGFVGAQQVRETGELSPATRHG